MVIWGEDEFILKIWGAKAKYSQGAEEFSFGDFGRAMHCFYGAGEHRPQPHNGPRMWWLGRGSSFSPKLFFGLYIYLNLLV